MRRGGRDAVIAWAARGNVPSFGKQGRVTYRRVLRPQMPRMCMRVHSAAYGARQAQALAQSHQLDAETPEPQMIGSLAQHATMLGAREAGRCRRGPRRAVGWLAAVSGAGAHALIRQPVRMIQVETASAPKKNTSVTAKLTPMCISDWPKKLQRKPLMR